MEKAYDLIIIGSGPAGLSAAVYAQRAQLNAITIEKSSMSGGQVLSTYEVDNYPGMPQISGFDLSQKLREHANNLSAVFIEDTVLSVDNSQKIKTVVCQKNSYKSQTIIIATGASHRKLGLASEETLAGKGVSYCATCDGMFFKDKITAVVGGGDVALEDAIFLSRICKEVYLIHRRDTFRGAKLLQHKVFLCENIKIIWDTEVMEINGDSKVSSLTVKNKITGETRDIPLDGVFIAVGITPESNIFRSVVDVDSNGYILADENGETSAKGIFAAGDVRTKALRQIVTAANDGANCVTSVEKYIFQ